MSALDYTLIAGYFVVISYFGYLSGNVSVMEILALTGGAYAYGVVFTLRVDRCDSGDDLPRARRRPVLAPRAYCRARPVRASPLHDRSSAAFVVASPVTDRGRPAATDSAGSVTPIAEVRQLARRIGASPIETADEHRQYLRRSSDVILQGIDPRAGDRL